MFLNRMIQADSLVLPCASLCPGLKVIHRRQFFGDFRRWADLFHNCTGTSKILTNYAIGVIIDDGEKKYYVTGDTLYNNDIFEDIQDDIYAVFLPINGVGNNMNMNDAKAFCEKINPKFAIPIHYGMFDEIDPNAFKCKNKVIPVIYNRIDL